MAPPTSPPPSEQSSPRRGGPDRLRVLVIAEACNPEWVSVPLVGWSHYEALARRQDLDVHLVTQVRNRDALLRAGLRDKPRAAAEAGEDTGRSFTAIDNEHIASPIVRLSNWLRGGTGKGWTTATAMAAASYYEFERLVANRFRRGLRRGEWDVVHRLTPLSPTTPSLAVPLACRESGVPFMLGPLNGGVPWPEGYGGVRRAEREWLSYVRDVYRCLPGYSVTRRLASAIVVASRSTLEQVPPRYRDKCFYIPENAVDPARFASVRPSEKTSREGPLRLLFVGRLVPYKGADLVIEAAAELLRSGRATLTIVGEGPQRQELEAMLDGDERLAAAVTLTGRVEHERVQEHMREADVFAFPSIREFGGGVVLEAMAMGLPVIGVAYGGPAELITPGTGIAMPIARREELILGLREAVVKYEAQPALAAEHALGAWEMVQAKFTWDAKADRTACLYHWLARPTANARPVFAMPWRFGDNRDGEGTPDSAGRGNSAVNVDASDESGD